MFDCGEGTQRQMQRSLGLTQVGEIYLTHFHADHILGLPGLLKTYDLTDRQEPLTIYGPPGPERPLRNFGAPGGPARIRARPDRAGARRSRVRQQLRDTSLQDRAPGALLRLCAGRGGRPGRFDPEAAKRLGVSEGPDFARLQRGEEVEGSSGPVSPSEVMGESREGRKVVVNRRHGPLQRNSGSRLSRRAPHPRRQLRRGGGPASRRNRSLHRRPGGGSGPRG